MLVKDIPVLKSSNREPIERMYYMVKITSIIIGNWTIIVRQAGHGATANVVIDQHELTAGTTGLSTLQIVIMLACIIWGAIGTSLYFKGRNNHAHT
jgi:hypothetical protein